MLEDVMVGCRALPVSTMQLWVRFLQGWDEAAAG